ncbi:MAG: porin family protein [bacterium]
MPGNLNKESVHMKRFIVLAILIALVIPPVYGMDFEIAQKGVKVGINLANASGTTTDPGAGIDKKSKIKFGVGGYAEFEVNEMFSVMPELWILWRGNGYEGSGTTASFSFTNLEIPILARYYILPDNDFKPVAFAGPVIGMNFGSNANIDMGALGTSDGKIQNASFFQLGLAFGAGAQYEFMNGYLVFDVRYYMGLTNFLSTPSNSDLANASADDIWLVDTDDQGNVIDVDAKHNGIMFSVGYAF